jgi:magnesium transporter
VRMNKKLHIFTKKKLANLGQPPGALIFTGEKKVEKPRITVIDYDEKKLQEKVVHTIEECFSFKDTSTVTWINIDGLHDVEIMGKIGSHFKVHPLVLEDILNTTQRPKMDDMEDHIFVTLKMLLYEEESGKIDIEQVSLIIGTNFVISFQEKEGDVFNPIRERIKTSKGRVRKLRADYLAYTLIDAIVDSYFSILERFGEEIELLDDELIKNPTTETASKIHTLKREFIFLRRSIWPLRELISGLERGESKLFKKSTLFFLRDLYDHTIQVIDSIEAYRSNRMNEVMKVLTIIATIFIPLTFIAGIYGMNFQFMPELAWRWSYPIVWIIIGITGIFMFIFFKRKRWL